MLVERLGKPSDIGFWIKLPSENDSKLGLAPGFRLVDVDLDPVIRSYRDPNGAPLLTQFLWTHKAETIEAGYLTPPDQWVWPPEAAR